MRIQSILKQATSTTASLDAELLLCHVLKVTRTYLYTRPEQELTDSQITTFLQLVAKRATGIPLAYLLGSKEFWSLDLQVNEHTLIPRPETELLIETLLQRYDDTPIKVADLGTGSGAIALALAKERPSWKIIATDINPHALTVAKSNLQQLGLQNVSFIQSDWYEGLADRDFDVLVSNPPYIAENDSNLANDGVRFEPQLALTSGADGLNAIRKLIAGASAFLKTGGLLLLEHGADQGAAVRALFAANHFKQIITIYDLAQLERATCGVV